MESTATLSIPRLRISRNHHALERFFPTSPHDDLPEPGVPADEDLDGNDRDDDQENTPKMSSTALLGPTETPAARLRALLALSPASSKSTPKPLPPSRSSDIDSDFEPLNASYGSTPSAARESLKDIFSRAKRDPGNTPQKDEFKPRRNSIDTSEVDATPRIERQRKENKGKRKSLSDEETDPARTSEISFRSSQAATFDILRERLINSQSQLKDLRLPDSTYHDSIPDDVNEAIRFSRETNSTITTTTLPVATSTPQQSLHMFIDSHLASQSNLLDRDSEMHRAFEGFDSSDTDGSQRPVSFPPSVTSANPTQKPPSSQLTRTLRSLLTRETYATDSSHVSASDGEEQHATLRFGISRRSILREDHKPDDLDLEKNLAHVQSPPRVPSVGPSSSRNPPGQRDFDEISSKGSSLGSQVDYQERTAELKRERKLERERDWNKSRSSRPTLNSDVNLPSTVERNRARTTQRHHSPTASSRASSPAGSLVSSHDHDDDNDDEDEIAHERERNWNARPKWAHGPPRPISPFKTQPPGSIIIEESSKTLASRKGGSAQRSHAINKSRSINDLTAPAQAISASRPSPSPHAPPDDHTHFQKLQINGATPPRSPSPSTSKGKGKALNQSPSEADTTPLDSLHSERTSFSTVKSGPGPSPSPGFSFMKKRIPLEPIELETGKLGQQKRNDLLSLSTRSKTSAKLDGIPIRSPQKMESLDKATIQSSSPVPNIKSESSFVSELNSKPHFLDVSSVVHKDRDKSSEVLEKIQPRSSAPLPLPNGKLEPGGTSLQQQLDSNPSEPVTQKPRKLQESPLPPPPSQSPPRDLRNKPISPLMTPPRRPSTSEVEFQTPSTPKNIPDLPGPPTSSEDEVEEESARAPFARLRADLTAMKTPRPPGAWTYTPAPLRRISRLSLSENSIKHEEPTSHPQMADHDFRQNMDTAEISESSGSQDSTPISFSSEKQDPPRSGDHEKEQENGLLTPTASFSKGFLSYAKTPAPPGAYLVTPAGRKSVARVRFDGVNNRDSTDSMTKDPLEDITNSSSSNATPRTTLPQVAISSRARTRELSTPSPASPVSRRNQSQTPGGIRVLDAFGRELVKDEAGKTENNVLKNGIRVVDALGREVDNDQASHSSTEGNVSESSVPLKHGEALLRVRQGLSDLVSDLDEMDKLEQNGQEFDHTRLEKLQQTSAEAQVARARVSAAISSNAEDIERKLRARMKESRLSIHLTGGRRWQVSWIIYFFLIIQLSLIIAMYRISATRARELFLTTYYDPFYPDLHLYITKSDTLQFSMRSFSRVSWFAFPHTFYFEDWKASALQIWHNLSIIIRNWQQLLWDKVGEGSTKIANWPPT